MGRPLLALIVATFALALAPAAAQAQGDDTVWLCKPGQADDLCNAPTTIDGETLPPPYEEAQPLGYTRPADAPIDCFYLYPTQSTQAGPNADLAKDPPIRRVVVQQARMFSSVCDVYAPMYRQVTLNGDQSSYNASVETAYQSAKAAFEDFLANESQGRGFMLLGHSQGSAHTARLISELIDTDPELRERFVGAIAPGANIAVPINEAVGGQFENVPACTQASQFGCVTAFSTYKGTPPSDARFSRLDTGYWIYPQPRFSSAEFEVMCTNPAVLDGGNGGFLPLVNFDYLAGVPAGGETAEPWRGQPDYYRGECLRQGGAHWLNLTRTNIQGDTRLDLGAFVAEGSNYHVPEVNLTEGNLLEIAQLQTDAYRADVQVKLDALEAKLKKAKKRLAADQKQIKKLRTKLKRADSAGERKKLKRKLNSARKDAKAERKQIKSLKRQIAELQQQRG